MNQQNRNLPVPYQRKKANNKKWVFLSVGLAALGTISYFGWQYFKTNKQSSPGQSPNTSPDYTSNIPDTNTVYTPPPSGTTTPIPATTSGFPLKKGSKGEKVKALQQALINAHGNSILPKYGADGDFGTETLNALIKLNLPQVIDETTFNVLVKTATIDPVSTAKKLYEAIKNKSYPSAIATLKTIKSTTDYSAVSNEFKKYEVNTVSKTLVNGMLDNFTTEAQKQEIRLAFVAMGLTYDGDKWALSGINDRVLVTNMPTIIWKDPNNSVAVPSKMVLGKFIAKRGDFIMFENEGQKFLVKSQHVNNYKVK